MEILNEEPRQDIGNDEAAILGFLVHLSMGNIVGDRAMEGGYGKRFPTHWSSIEWQRMYIVYRAELSLLFLLHRSFRFGFFEVKLGSRTKMKDKNRPTASVFSNPIQRS